MTGGIRTESINRTFHISRDVMARWKKVLSAEIVIFTIAGEALLLLDYADCVSAYRLFSIVPGWVQIGFVVLMFGCACTAPVCAVLCPTLLMKFGELKPGKATNVFRLLNIVGTIAGCLTPWIWGIVARIAITD